MAANLSIFYLQNTPFVLPDRNESFRRAIAYLTKTRRIDAQLVLDEIKKGNIYEDSIYHNVVFVGRKPNGEPVWAQKRTTISDKKTIFDHPGSDARYGYYTGNPTPKIVVVVESPIEALSLVSLMKYHNKPIDQLGFLSLGGVHDTALKQFLIDHPECKNIITALNNDSKEKPDEIKGREGSEIIRNRYEKQGYNVTSIFPKLNDWNDELRAIRKLQEEKKPELSPEERVEQQIKEYAKRKRLERQKEKTLQPVRVRQR